MLTRKTCFALAALLLVAPACSKEFVGVGEGIPPASFTLQTINGQSVPLTAAIRGTVRVEILSGTFTIESTYQFTNSTTYRRTENGQATTVVENCVGTYDPTITTGGITTLAFSELGADNAQCGVQLGAGGRTRNYSGTWNGSNTLTADFDITTHSVYGK
ncbi:MAG: hypothetical protein ABR582_01845 [Gemmatimonadaceae bacterium]